MGFLALVVLLALQYPRIPGSFQVDDRLRSSEGELTLEALDLIAEPGEISDSETLDRFYERQDRLAEILSAPTQYLNDNPLYFVSSINPLHSLPIVFWIQLTVGLGAFILSAWVWSLKDKDQAARLLLSSGIATLIFTSSAAIYSTRALALPARDFKILVDLNVIGASLFGIFTINMFLCYPLRLRYFGVMSRAQMAVFGGLTALSIGGVLPPWAGVNLITLSEMLAICLAVGVQFFATKYNPLARACLAWLGLSFLLGAGFFIGLTAAPLVFDQQSVVEQGYAFLSFLALYLGLAAGVGRFRLFEVGEWAFRLLFYGIGTLALVLVDGLLIYAVGIERSPAFAFSLLFVSLVYLPLKTTLRERVSPKPRLKADEILGDVLDVSFARTLSDRRSLWKNLLVRLYNPLRLEPELTPVEKASLAEEGVCLLLPPIGSIPSLRLSYPSAGQSLFSSESLRIANQLVALMRQAETNRESYERGTREERRRIAQDLHDDVGASLLTLLHSAETDTRNAIASVIGEMRSIVDDVSGEGLSVRDVLADLRHETVKRMDSVGIALVWPLPIEDWDFPLGYREQKALRSGVRELVSNIIRHSQATRVTVRYEFQSQGLSLELRDDGLGVDSSAWSRSEGGFGLKSLRQKAAQVGGRLHLESSAAGTNATLFIPYEATETSNKFPDEWPLGWPPRDSIREVSDKWL